MCLRTQPPGKAWSPIYNICFHNADQSILWTRKNRIAPGRGHTGIVNAVERIIRQVIVRRPYLVANNCPILSSLAVRLKAYLPVAGIGFQKRKTYAAIARVLYPIAHLFRPVPVMTERDIGAMVQ